jgi:hypothetical protein
MYEPIEKAYLYNPFDVKEWSDKQIEEQVRALMPRYDAKETTMFGLAKNVETLANIMYLFGEMIARLTREYGLLKIDVDAKEKKQITIQRRTWVEENPNDKVPAMSFFEAKAAEFVRDDKDKLMAKYEQLTRFKQAYDSYEQIINATKKKMDAIKYEEFNK